MCSQNRVGRVIVYVMFLRPHYSLLTTHTKKKVTVLNSFMARNLFSVEHFSFQLRMYKTDYVQIEGSD